jgi:hypothetical protein
VRSASRSSLRPNFTYVARLYPSVATKATSGSRPLRTQVKSACICWPGGVSNRTTGSGVPCLSGANHALSWLMPPS